MKYTACIMGLAALLLLAAGCASTNNLPSGAQRVGGGLLIDWEAPTDGTAVLVEITTGKIVATATMRHSGSNFEFDASREQCAEVLKATFATMPTNAHFILYFVPAAKKD